MKEIEVRFEVNEEQILKVEKLTKLETKNRVLDISYGEFGFDSYEITKKVRRIRNVDGNISLEIKIKKGSTNEKGLLITNSREESKPLTSVKEGDKEFREQGLLPYLYLDRVRETRTCKDLIICIDRFDILGTYMEIEFQDSNIEELKEFLKLVNIKNYESKPVYGDILKERLLDPEFKLLFEENLQKITSNQNVR